MLILSGFVKHTGKKHEKYKTVIYELHLDGDLKKKCARFELEMKKHTRRELTARLSVRPLGRQVSGLLPKGCPACSMKPVRPLDTK